eukprot:2980761-Rhodomonas_salina.1
MSLFERFINSLDVHVASILPLFTHSKGTSAQKLGAALNRLQSSDHFARHNCLLKHVINMLRENSDNLFIRPGEEQAQDRLQQVRSLLRNLPSIVEPQTILNSPLSNQSRSDLEIACQGICERTIRALKDRTPLRGLQDDIDHLALLARSIDVERVSAAFDTAIQELKSCIIHSCTQAQQALCQGSFSDVQRSLNGIDGFEWLEKYCPELKRLHWAPVIATINNEVQLASNILENVPTAHCKLQDPLDLLKGADFYLKEFLQAEHHRAYKNGKAKALAYFKQLASQAQSFIQQHIFSSDLQDCLQGLVVMESLSEHFDDASSFLQDIQEHLCSAISLLGEQICNKLDLQTLDSTLAADIRKLQVAAMIPSRHAELAQETYEECVGQFGEACNKLFAAVDTALLHSNFEVVGTSLEGLKAAAEAGAQSNGNLLQRFTAKLLDVDARVEVIIASISSRVDSGLTCKEEHDSCVLGLQQLAQATKSLPVCMSDQCLRFNQELHSLHSRLELELAEVQHFAVSCLETPDNSSWQADGSVFEKYDRHSQLLSAMERMEWMCGAELPLPLSNGHLFCEFMHTLRDFCHITTKALISVAKDAQVQGGQTVRRSFRAVMDLESAFRHALQSGQQFNNLFNLKVFADASTDPCASTDSVNSPSDSYLTHEGDKTEYRLDFQVPGESCFPTVAKVSCFEDLIGSLQEAAHAAVQELSRWKNESKARFQEHIALDAFREANILLQSIKDFEPLETQTKIGFGEACTDMVTCAQNHTATRQQIFNQSMSVNDLQSANGMLQTVRAMLVLQQDVAVVQPAVEQLSAAFYEKTSRFKLEVTSFLAAGNFKELAMLLAGHKSLAASTEAMSKEFIETQELLGDHWKCKFEVGMEVAHGICHDKAMSETRLLELAAVIREFSNAKCVFRVLDDEHGCIERLQTLKACVRRKIEAAVLHGRRSVHLLDIRAYSLVADILRSLKIVQGDTGDIEFFEIEEHLSTLQTDFTKRVEELPTDVSMAFEAGNSRQLDKVLTQLRTSLELAGGSGLQVTVADAFERVEVLVDNSMQELSQAIDASLSAYDVETATIKMKLFKKLLRSEDIRPSWAEQSEEYDERMGWIKDEIVHPQVLKRSPEKVQACLRGFRQVNFSFFERIRSRILDMLNDLVHELILDVQKREVWALNAFPERMELVQGYETSLQGHECDDDIQSGRSKLLNALREAINAVLDDADYLRSTSCWFEVEGLKGFLDQAVRFYISCKPDNDQCGEELLARHRTFSESITNLGANLEQKWGLVSAFDMWNPSTYNAKELEAFLQQLQINQSFINGRLGRHITPNLSNQRAVATLKSNLLVSLDNLSALWQNNQFAEVAAVVQGLKALSRIEALQPDVDTTRSELVRAICGKMDQMATACVSKFQGVVEERNVAANGLREVNIKLENLQRAQSEIATTREPGFCETDWVQRVVDSMMLWIEQRLRSLTLRPVGRECLAPEDLAQTVFAVWEIPSEISIQSVKEQSKIKIRKIFQSIDKKFNFNELAAILVDKGETTTFASSRRKPRASPSRTH